jgi:hypothetical protein
MLHLVTGSEAPFELSRDRPIGEHARAEHLRDSGDLLIAELRRGEPNPIAAAVADKRFSRCHAGKDEMGSSGA